MEQGRVRMRGLCVCAVHSARARRAHGVRCAHARMRACYATTRGEGAGRATTSVFARCSCHRITGGRAGMRRLGRAALARDFRRAKNVVQCVASRCRRAVAGLGLFLSLAAALTIRLLRAAARAWTRAHIRARWRWCRLRHEHAHSARTVPVLDWRSLECIWLATMLRRGSLAPVSLARASVARMRWGAGEGVPSAQSLSAPGGASFQGAGTRADADKCAPHLAVAGLALAGGRVASGGHGVKKPQKWGPKSIERLVARLLVFGRRSLLQNKLLFLQKGCR